MSAFDLVAMIIKGQKVDTNESLKLLTVKELEVEVEVEVDDKKGMVKIL